MDIGLSELREAASHLAESDPAAVHPSVLVERVTLSRRLADRPSVAAALTAGDISVDHAQLVTAALTELAETDEQLAADTEAPLLTVARQLDPVRLRREIAHARHALVPEAAAASDEVAHLRRRLDIATTFEGAVVVSGVLDAEGGETLLAASISRVITGPTGEPLDVGRRTRTIPAAIRTALVARDRGCVFPGCDRPPQWTDAHHVQHWADGGPTSLDNLVLLCRRHHRAVHEGRRAIVRDRGRWRLSPDARAGPVAA